MRKNYLFLPVCLLFALSLFVSCKKDKDSASKMELLTRMAWKADRGGADLDGNGTIDVEEDIEACIADNTLLFRTDGTGTFDEGATKCNTADPQTEEFNWSFSANQTQITYLGDDYKIISLTNDQLVVSTETEFLGATVNLVAILKH